MFLGGKQKAENKEDTEIMKKFSLSAKVKADMMQENDNHNQHVICIYMTNETY